MGDILSTLDEVRGCRSEIIGSVVAVLIIHGLCQASRVSEAFWVMDKLRNRNFKPDFMAYWIVAKAFRSTGNMVETNKVLKKNRKLGVAPRSNDYIEFILSLILERRICEAKELGEVIVRGNFPIEDDVLNALIGSVSGIDPDSAFMFFKFMVENKRFPTLLTLRNFSRNLCEHNRADELWEIFQILSFHRFRELQCDGIILGQSWESKRSICGTSGDEKEWIDPRCLVLQFSNGSMLYRRSPAAC